MKAKNNGIQHLFSIFSYFFQPFCFKYQCGISFETSIDLFSTGFLVCIFFEHVNQMITWIDFKVIPFLTYSRMHRPTTAGNEGRHKQKCIHLLSLNVAMPIVASLNLSQAPVDFLVIYGPCDFAPNAIYVWKRLPSTLCTNILLNGEKYCHCNKLQLHITL